MSTVIPVPDNWRPLFSSWDELRHGYHAGDKDETVRGCVRRLKQSRAIATRYDKRAYVFHGSVAVAAIRLWLRA